MNFLKTLPSVQEKSITKLLLVIVTLFILSISITSLDAQTLSSKDKKISRVTPSLYQSKEDGWFFYHEKIEEHHKPLCVQEEKIKKSSSEFQKIIPGEQKILPKKLSPSTFHWPESLSLENSAQTLENFSKHIQSHKALALLNPTQENISSYAKIRQEYLARAELFAHNWQNTLLHDPSLDPSSFYTPDREKQKELSDLEQDLKYYACDCGLRSYNFILFLAPDDKIGPLVKNQLEKIPGLDLQIIYSDLSMSLPGSKNLTTSLGQALAFDFCVSSKPLLALNPKNTVQLYPLLTGFCDQKKLFDTLSDYVLEHLSEQNINLREHKEKK